MEKTISSLTHPFIKHAKRLRTSRKYRQSCKSVIVSGNKLSQEIWSLFPVTSLITTQSFSLPSFPPAKMHYVISHEMMKKITGLVSPEEIALELPLPNNQDLKGLQRILACDKVTDPGNLGTLFRTAEALNFNGIFLVNGCVDPFNSKVINASKGANFRMPLLQGTETDLLKLIEKEGLTTYSADLKGEGAHTITYQEPLVLILGSEAHGVSKLLNQSAVNINIPMNPSSESLNVAVAGSIIMFQMNHNHG